MGRLVSLLLLPLLLALSSVPGADPPVRRAVLVGINQYVDSSSGGPNALKARSLGNLDGPANDVEAMKAVLVSRFGFAEENVLVLIDAEATRAGILSAIRDFLGQSRAGDHALFFYAGHGSWVKNSRSSEADQRDETIVPVDAATGVPDIRDKELRGPFDALLDRGVDVTLIFDSCHSGSITRGVDPGKERSVKPAPGDIADDRTYPPPPQDHPSGRALVFSAAQDQQKAREFFTEGGPSAGAFTWALLETLRSNAGSVPASYLFQQIRAVMKARGFEQDPVFEAGDSRRTEPLFSGGADARYSGVVVPVLQVESDKDVILNAGLATGLRAGTELISADPDATHLRVRVTESLGMGRSRATAVRGTLRGLAAGDLLLVERWAVEPSEPLRFWTPPTIADAEDAEAVFRTASLLRSDPEVRWIDDPTKDPPTHVLEWNGTSWHMTAPLQFPFDLGTDPTADEIREALAASVSPARLFVSLPPSDDLVDELSEAVARTQGGASVQTHREGATYRLVGTVTRGARRYFWMHHRAASGGSSGGMPPTTEATAGRPRDVAHGLATQIDRLSRSWGWLHLTAPPVTSAFPYRITGYDRADVRGTTALADTLTWGGQYRVVLEAPVAVLADAVRAAYEGGTARWYWYLFAMDRQGTGTLLYPRASNQPNKIDLFASGAREQIRIAVPDEKNWLFSPAPSNPDMRTDFATVFLLASAEMLPDPMAIFNFSGVGSRASSDADSSVVAPSTLSRLLFDLGNGSRGGTIAAPVLWDLQRAPVISADSPR